MKTPLFLCLLVSSALVGCVRSDPTPPANPTWLRWASPNPVPLSTLSDCQSDQCLPFSGLVREGLSKVVWQGETLRTQPALAESWTEADKTWTVVLKKDLEWNDGKKLTAQSLIENWKSVLSNCRKYSAASLFFGIENAEGFCMGKTTEVGWKAVDARTLEFTLNQANPDFPQIFAHPLTWPGRKAPGPKSTLSIGPFQPAGRTAGGDVRFTRNPKYHGTTPPMDGILVQWVSEAEVRMEMFLQGETDLVTDLPDSLWASLAHEKDLKSVPTDRFYIAMFDPEVAPFQEKSVRRAFQRTYETKEVIDLMKPFLAPAAGLFPNSPTAPVPQWAVLFSPKGLGETVQKWIEPMPKVKGLPAVTYRASGDDPFLEKIVQNLTVQWQRRLNAKVVPAKSLGKKPAIRILSHDLSPLGGNPTLNRFVRQYLGKSMGEAGQQEWIREEAYALPLAFRSRPLLVSQRLGGLNCPGIVPCDLGNATASQ